MIPITHQVAERRFEFASADAPPAILDYREEGGVVFFEHTFVPDELRGQGVAAALVRSALEEARRSGWRVVPRCSYVASFIERHPEFADVAVEQ